MKDRALKEQRKHGEPGLPVSCYRIRPPYYNMAQLECHWHDEMELFEISRGTARIQCGSSHFTAREGDLVLFNSGELHAAQPLDQAEMEFQAVVFGPEMLCGDESDVSRARYVTPLLDGRLQVPRVIRRETGKEPLEKFGEVLELLERREPAYELRVRARLLDIFACFAAAGELRGEAGEAASCQAVKSAIDYIHGHYQRQITITELAQLCHMSGGHFCRMFKKYTLKTPVQYINSVRLSSAMELLSHTDRKVLDIAMDTGFNSLSYFIGVFKDSFGCTPTQFRKPNAFSQPAPSLPSGESPSGTL